jgi:hypothetical protein
VEDQMLRFTQHDMFQTFFTKLLEGCA